MAFWWAPILQLQPFLKGIPLLFMYEYIPSLLAMVFRNPKFNHLADVAWAKGNSYINYSNITPWKQIVKHKLTLFSYFECSNIKSITYKDTIHNLVY